MAKKNHAQHAQQNLGKAQRAYEKAFARHEKLADQLDEAEGALEAAQDELDYALKNPHLPVPQEDLEARADEIEAQQ